MDIQIRFANKEDLPRVNELRKQVNELHVAARPDVFRPGFNEALQRHIYEEFADGACAVIVAVLDGAVCGFATVQFLDKPQTAYSLARRVYRVEEFGVDAAHRRQGVASALVAFLRQDAARRGYDRLDLDVWEFNEPARAFYDAMGFQAYRRYLELPL